MHHRALHCTDAHVRLWHNVGNALQRRSAQIIAGRKLADSNRGQVFMRHRFTNSQQLSRIYHRPLSVAK